MAALCRSNSLIDSKNPRGITKPATLKRIERLQAEIEEIPELTKPVSIVNSAKYMKQAFYNGLPKYYQLPSRQDRTFISNYVKNSMTDSNMLVSFIDSTGQKARISTFLSDVQTTRMEEIEALLQQKITKIFPQNEDPKKGTMYL